VRRAIFIRREIHDSRDVVFTVFAGARRFDVIRVPFGTDPPRCDQRHNGILHVLDGGLRRYPVEHGHFVLRLEGFSLQFGHKHIDAAFGRHLLKEFIFADPALNVALFLRRSQRLFLQELQKHLRHSRRCRFHTGGAVRGFNYISGLSVKFHTRVFRVHTAYHWNIQLF